MLGIKNTTHSVPDTRNGFTIVELLIVVVVIAILAAITIVAYNGINNKAKASSAQSAAAQTHKKILSYAIDNAEQYPATLATISISDGSTTYQYSVNNTASPKTFCLTTTTGNQSYYVSTTASKPTAGACPGHGFGGEIVLTNNVTNPSSVTGLSNISLWAGSGGGTATLTRQASAWSARGWAARSTWTAPNSSYTGDLGYLINNTGGLGTLQPNTQYTLIWKVRVSKSQRLMPTVGNWVVLNGATGSGTGTTNATSGVVVVAANTATDQWITFTTGANTIGGKVFSSLVSGTGASLWATNDYIEMSDFMMVTGNTVPNFADGDTAGWAWTGTSNASTSTGPAQ